MRLKPSEILEMPIDLFAGGHSLEGQKLTKFISKPVPLPWSRSSYNRSERTQQIYCKFNSTKQNCAQQEPKLPSLLKRQHSDGLGGETPAPCGPGQVCFPPAPLSPLRNPSTSFLISPFYLNGFCSVPLYMTSSFYFSLKVLVLHPRQSF